MLYIVATGFLLAARLFISPTFRRGCFAAFEAVLRKAHARIELGSFSKTTLPLIVLFHASIALELF